MAINFFNSLAVGTNVLYVDTLTDRVGIGTDNPGGLLHVSSGTSGDAVVIIESDTDNSNENDNPHVELRQDGGGIKAKLGIEGDAGSTYSNSVTNATYLGTVFEQPLQFITGNTGGVQTAKMTIEPNSGNVGIGTTSPSQKLHVSGNARVTGAYYDSNNTPGTLGQILSSTATGTDWIDQDTIISAASKLVVIACKNTSGATITKGTPVYQTGTVGATDVIEVAEADSSDEDKMQAIGLLQTDIANNAFGNVVITGELLNFTTSPIDGVTPTTGDTIYVKPGGGLTLTKPTGLNFIQNVGLVGKVSGGNAGSLTVSSIMRSNDVPTPLYVDHDNQRLGIGTTNPVDKFQIDAANSQLRLRDTDDGSYTQFSSSGNKLAIRQGSTSANHIWLTSAGDVGIGTPSPRTKLDINGPLAVIGGTFTSGASGADSSSSTGIVLRRGKKIFSGIPSSGNEDFYLRNLIEQDTSNNINIGQTGTALIGDITLNTGSSGNVIFRTTGSESARIDSIGNVGIGVTSPGAKLDVFGTIRTFGSYGHLVNGSTNVFRTCTYSPENIFMSGKSNSVGGQNNAAIGSSNIISCSSEPWLQLGGNLIAGMNNVITGGYSHANAVFGQNNTLADQGALVSEAGSLMSGDGNTLFSTNSFSWGYQTFAQGDASLTGGYQSVSFGNSGSVSIGLGCTASTGATQYAFGTGVTTPTTATAAEINDQFAIGRFNVYATSIGHLFAIGNGSSDGSRNTALAVIGEGAYTNGQLSLNDFNGYSSSIYQSKLHVAGNATKTTGSSWISVSDERLKSNIQVYEKGLSEILQITPKTFEFNGKAGTQAGQSQVGIIAQEIKDVLPESINIFNKKLEETDETETELYDFDQDPLVYTLLNAVKELSAKIDTLENRIQTLEAN
jgi:Chaperone of endosialidase